MTSAKGPRPEYQAFAAHVTKRREAANLSQSELGRRLNVSPQAVQQWEAGETRPRGYRLRALAKLLGTTEVALLADDPDATTDTGLQRALAPGALVREWSGPYDLSDAEFTYVRRVRIELAAGNGHLVDREEDGPPLAFRTEWIRKNNLVRENLRVVYVSGSSMEPYLNDGDVVVIDLAARAVRDGEVFALRYGDEVRVKRLFKRVDGGIIVRSDNRAQFPDEQLAAEQLEHIEIIGRVVWRGG